LNLCSIEKIGLGGKLFIFDNPCNVKGREVAKTLWFLCFPMKQIVAGIDIPAAQ